MGIVALGCEGCEFASGRRIGGLYVGIILKSVQNRFMNKYGQGHVIL